MHRLSLFLSRMLPMFLVMAGIFFISSIPGDRLHLPDIANIDKIAHIVAYGVLAITVIHAIGPWFGNLSPHCLSLAVILFCIIYGISDEYHQTFIQNRFPSIFDIFADGVGAGIVCLVRNSNLSLP